MSNILRWALVLPAALLGYAIAQVAIILVTFALPTPIARQLGALVSPIGFVVLGARVAPSRQTQTAGVLSILSFLTQGMFAMAIVLRLRTETSTAENLIALIVGVVGTVIGLYIAYLQERQRIQPALT